MTNHLAEASGIRTIPKGDRVVGDAQKDPVCLDAIPGAHKHFGETEMLFDVLVKELDREAFGVKTHHFGFGHVEVVGDKESGSLPGLGDKDEHGTDPGEIDFLLGNPKPFLFGDANSLVSPRSLCQVTRRKLLSVSDEESIRLDSRKESPAGFLNRIEDRGTAVPDIHDDGESLGESPQGPFENFPCQFDLAFESCLRATLLGPVAPNRPTQPLGTDFEDGGHRTQSSNRSVDRVMKPDPFDLLAVPGTRRVVQNHDRFLGFERLGQLPLVFFFQNVGSLRRVLQKMMKAVGIPMTKLASDFLNRTEFDKPGQTDQVNQKVLSLRFGQNLQERSQIGRNLFRAFCAHGFRALLALPGIGDFGRKPFCLKWLSCLVA